MIEIENLPLHKKTTIVAERFIIAVIERTDESTAIISYVNLKTRDEVLRVFQKADGDQILESLNTNYWSITSEGEVITEFEISRFEDLNITVDISTRNKTVELLNFKNSKLPA